MVLKMLEGLLTEQPHPGASRLDQLATEDLIRLMNEADAEIAAAVAKQIPRIARAVDAVAEVLENGGSLFYIGGEPADGWGCWTPPNARRRLTFRRGSSAG